MEEQQQEYYGNMEATREILTENIETFMAKREVEMKEHRAQRQRVIDVLTTIINGLWGSARVEVGYLHKKAFFHLIASLTSILP